jgi:hypothetical protein
LKVPADLLSERDFAAQVADLARALGWRRFHVYDSRRSRHGWPDEVLVRGLRFVVAELKVETGKPTADQAEWLDALATAGLEVYLWRPSMLDAIAAHLAHRERPAEPGPGAWKP